MAIHGEIPGIEVTVRTNKKNLAEYNVDNDPITHQDRSVQLHQDRYTKTVFIESQAGKSFTINLRVRRPYVMTSAGLCFRVFVDGEVVKKPLLRAVEYSTKYWKDEVIGPVVKHGSFGEGVTYNTMLFTEIASTLDNLPQNQIEEQKSIMYPVGDIEVRVYRVSEGRVATTSPDAEPRFKGQFDPDQKYHIKSLVKDAKTHGTTLGAEQICGRPATFQVTEIDGPDYPLVIFRFKYRCKRALQDLRLMPMPENAELRSIGGHTLNRAVKRRTASFDSPSEIYTNNVLGVVKHHSRPSKRPKSSSSPEIIDIIDLTGDDEESIIDLTPRRYAKPLFSQVTKLGVKRAFRDFAARPSVFKRLEIFNGDLKTANGTTGRGKLFAAGQSGAVDLTSDDNDSSPLQMHV